MILAAADGLNNQQIATQLGVYRGQVRLWRNRWLAATDHLKAVEEAEEKASLHSSIETLLADAPRAGTPATFSPEQIIDIIAVACEDPQDSDHPLSHWTPSALCREVLKRQVVDAISPRQVGRFLKGSGFETASESLLAPSPVR
jgi:putative transposase